MRTSVGWRLFAFMTDDDVAIVLNQSQIACRDRELGSIRTESPFLRTPSAYRRTAEAKTTTSSSGALAASRARWTCERADALLR